MESEKKDWRYTVKEHDPEKLRNAAKELEAAEDELDLIDIEDDYDCPVKGVIVYKDGKEHLISCKDDEPVHVDFKQQEVKLPQNVLKAYGMADESVTSKLVRYCGMPKVGYDLPMNDGDLAVLSLWNGDARDIINVHIVTENAKASAILLNALTRFIYESNDKNAVRTHKFFPTTEGYVDVAFCSTDERDMRDALKQRKESEKKEKAEGSGDGDKKSSDGDKKLETDAANEDEGKGDDKKEELPDLIKTPMYFVFDEEALCLYDHPFTPLPLHDFRFYREATPKSIDTIFVCNTEEQLEIQQGENVFFIHPRTGHERSQTAYTELVETLRAGSFKPKSEEIFKGTGMDFEKFFTTGDTGKSGKGGDDVSPASEPGDMDDDLKSQMHPMRNMPERGMPFRNMPEHSMQQRSVPMSDESSAVSASLPWLNNLNTGDHLLANVSEDMQMMWFAVEPELEQIILQNKVPHIDIESSGMNPQSAQHLQTAVEDIRDKILSNKHAEALSHLRGCLNVYGKTLLSAAMSTGEVELLKRIYFLTG